MSTSPSTGDREGLEPPRTGFEVEEEHDANDGRRYRGPPRPSPQPFRPFSSPPQASVAPTCTRSGEKGRRRGGKGKRGRRGCAAPSAVREMEGRWWWWRAGRERAAAAPR
jgi:hypothetical protein